MPHLREAGRPPSSAVCCLLLSPAQTPPEPRHDKRERAVVTSSSESVLNGSSIGLLALPVAEQRITVPLPPMPSLATRTSHIALAPTNVPTLLTIGCIWCGWVQSPSCRCCRQPAPSKEESCLKEENKEEEGRKERQLDHFRCLIKVARRVGKPCYLKWQYDYNIIVTPCF
ncbi:hypothetical protein SORBI_3010G077225 [Sorghum bicolor]|uniref:Uncharacterized protein n=1 Tax=Sorghum bicolor TaxID=4558 RepID=A0A1W0VRW3_SORBI|nr:hypothetical protein SORBI_3010G077225 [Sorghum bicolor]